VFNYFLHQTQRLSLLFRFLILITLSVLGSAYCICQVGRLQGASVSAANSPRQEATATLKPSLQAHYCATKGFLPIETSKPNNAHHTVTLSWNASTPSVDPAAGYCLYKSETDADPKNPQCSSCEPVTPTPITKTSCIDDIVKDGTTYHYLVRAVDIAGNASGWSNVATAPVPSSDEVRASPVATSPPARCRLPPSGK